MSTNIDLKEFNGSYGNLFSNYMCFSGQFATTGGQTTNVVEGRACYYLYVSNRKLFATYPKSGFLKECPIAPKQITLISWGAKLVTSKETTTNLHKIF